MRKLIVLLLLGLSFQLWASPVLLDDFEDGTSGALPLGSLWLDFDDGYSSVVTVHDEVPGQGSSAYCMKTQISLKPGNPFPNGGLVLPFTPEQASLDIGSYEGVRFWAKGSGVWDFGIYIEATLEGLNPFYYPMEFTDEWALYEVPFTRLAQQFGEVQFWDPSTALGILFLHKNSLMNDQVLFLDNMEFYGSSPASKCQADVNTDGVTDIVDALAIACYVIGGPQDLFDAAAADVDSDGVISILDAVIVARYAADLGNLPGCDQIQRADDMPLLGRGINLGNRLDAPYEGAWGAVLEEWQFDVIADGGFDSLRLPIRWSSHTTAQAPYTIDPAFFDRVDWAVGLALDRGLNVIVNMHHYDELFLDPYAEKEKFLAIWQQLGEHYADYPDDRIVLEVLNEPNTMLTPEIWNEFLAEAVEIIRVTNPRKWILVDTASWGGLYALNPLVLPVDPRLILSIHYYQPTEFVYQGADWIEGSDQWLGTVWGTDEEKARVLREFDYVARWAEDHDNIPVYMGEFSVIDKVPMDLRVLWTAWVVKAAEDRGFSWGYWELTEGLGCYDVAGGWNPVYYEALMQ